LNTNNIDVLGIVETKKEEFRARMLNAFLRIWIGKFYLLRVILGVF